MLREEIQKRKLPPLWEGENGGANISRACWETHRDEVISMLRKECYGMEYDKRCTVDAAELSCDRNALGGKAAETKVRLLLSGEDGKTAHIPVNVLLPHSRNNVPVFLWIQFEEKAEYGYKPVEEIIDHGYGIISCYYQDIVRDCEEDPNVQALFQRTDRYDWGTIGKWAYGLKRIMDYIQTLSAVDKNRIALVGGSRLGKTVLWTAATDRRFSLCVPMISGTGGVSMYRKNEKESLNDLLNKFPFWFGKNFTRYKNNEEKLPFDAHFLVALCAPGYLYFCSGTEDEYVDYKSEFLSAYAAEPVYELYGVHGLAAEDAWPSAGKPLTEGHIGCHIRKGTHFMSRYDWQQIICFREKHKI